jgi:hypothetical protein
MPKPKPPRDPRPAVSLDKWFTRAEAGRVLGLTACGVRALDNRGKIRSVVDDRGVHRYNPLEVHELNLRRRKRRQTPGRPDAGLPSEGALEGRVFELIDLYVDGGQTDQLAIKRLVVKELGITGEQYSRYYEDWRTSPDDQVAARKRDELQARHERRQREERELASRTDLERLRIEKEEARANADALKHMRRLGYTITPPKVDAAAAALEPTSADDNAGHREP